MHRNKRNTAQPENYSGKDVLAAEAHRTQGVVLCACVRMSIVDGVAILRTHSMLYIEFGSNVEAVYALAVS